MTNQTKVEKSSKMMTIDDKFKTEKKGRYEERGGGQDETKKELSCIWKTTCPIEVCPY